LCGTTQAERVVIVNPSTGETTFIAGAIALCQNAPNEIYTATSTNSTSISYSISPAGAGTINSSTGEVDWNSLFSGTATIQATSFGLCGTTNASRIVTINPLPVVIAGSDRTICTGSNTKLGGAAVLGNTYSWTSVPAGFTSTLADPLVNPIETTVYTLVETNSFTGCSNSGTVTVTVNPLPIVSAPESVCVGSTVVLSPTTGGTWISSNTSVATVTDAGVVSGVSAGSATFTFTNSITGCSATTTAVVVNQEPIFTFCPSDISENTTINQCNAVVNYSAIVIGSPMPTVSFSFSGATTDSGAGTGSGSIFNQGITTVIITATNSCGTKTCSFTVTVKDNELPVISCPVAISKPNDPALCGAVVAISDPIATDNCSTSFLFTGIRSDALPLTSVFPVGNTIIRWTATDEAGNVSETCEQIVTVTDDQKPTITAPVAVSVNSDAGLCTASGVILGTPVTADNCSVASVTNDAVEPFAIGNTTVTWTVTDASGNFETATQIVTVTDIQKPTIIAPAAVLVIADLGQCSASGIILGTPVTADNCSVASITNDAVEPFAIGNTTVTWTVTDASGNFETATQIVTVTDDQKPTITAPEAVSVNSDSGLCTASGVILGTPVTADNCTVASVTNDAVEPFAIGNTTVTWTVTDASGNLETATQLVTVTDDQKPTITAPEAVLINSDAGLCTASGVILGTPITADNCAVASVTNDAVEPFALGNTTITWTVTDSNGNLETATQIVTVNDIQKPTITAPAAVSVISDAGLCTASGVILGTPVTDDNCSVVSITNDAVQPFAIGSTTVTWTVTDGSGNSETATQIVSVLDDQNPTITAPSAVFVNSDAGLCTASGVILGTPVTADNCWVSSITNDAVEPFAIGNTTVTWTVSDASGNFATATQIVTVSDNQKPTITAPIAVSVNSDVDLCSASGVILGTPVTADNCSVASVTNDAVEPFAVGNTTVTWTVTDANGNIETETQLVTVIDNQKPVISCPANITTDVDLGICGASVVISDPSATDNCTTSFTFSGFRSDGALLTDLYPIGTTIISWTTSDLSGNVSETCTQEVIVADNENPVAVCKNIVINLDASGNASITADDINNGSSDNCGIQSVSVSKSSFSCSDIGLNTVTLTVYDINGNTSTCNSVVTVTDTNVPFISIGDIVYNENDRSVLFTVQLSNPRDCDVSFTAFTSDGSAFAGGDYTSLSPTVYKIPAGSSSVAIIIPIVDDTMYELTESFNLNLSNPKNCLLSDDQGVCTIIDNDVVPSVSIADAAAIEGNAINFRLNLSNPSYEAITLTFALTEGTASGTDYDTRNISITIPAGTVTLNIPVATVQDIIDEKDETFKIGIISVDSGTVGATSDTAVGTILDDDNFPVAIDDVYTTTEDTPVTLDVLLNDTYGGDGSFNGKITSENGLHGTVTVNNGGTPNDPIDDKLEYTPEPDYFGPDSFTYTICDRTPDCSTATVNITVTSVNDLPVANDDAISTEEDVNIEGETAAGNDLPSGDGDNVWTLIGDNGGAMNGTVTMSADGTYNYIPNPNFNGSDSFTYQICDKEGDCDSAVVNITVTSLNDKPVAVNDVFYNIEDLPILGETVAGNDIPSGDGGNIWSLVGTNGGALNGTVTMYPDGNFDYYPLPNFNGTENFTYQICDVDGECETARVTIILDAVGDAPYTEDDNFTTTEDTQIIGASVAGNDLPSIDGGNKWSLFGTYGGASHGKVVMNADGTFNYTPDANFIGTDTFIYLLCDKENDCSGAQVTITVNPANDSPIARDDINMTLMGMPASGNVLINDIDPDGDLLTINTNPVTAPAHGTVLINSDGIYIYTPNPDYSGSDSFVYEVCDNGTPVLCSRAKVTISIIELINENNAPIAINDDYLGSEGLPVNGNVISNDIDPDGNLNMNSVTVMSMDPQNGTFTMNPNGTFIFTPNAGFIGEVSFDYRICDLGTPALCDLATVTITILADPDKNSTFATDDSYFGREDKTLSGNVLSNDNDPQGDIQTVNTTPVVSPKHGAVVLNANGTFTYTPEPNFIGSDQFAYRLCDNGIPQACDQANVYLIIAPENDSPMAEDDINTTFKDMPVSGNVLTNDSDPEGDLMTIKTNPVVSPSNGTVVINPDGTYLYTPNSGYSGTDSFVYEVCDTGIPVMCDQAKVTIKVIDLTSTNNPPVAINDAYQGSIGLAVSGNVISNDFDPDGNLNPTSVTLVGSASATGELILNPDGTFTYIPEAGYLGRISFDYSICDTGTPSLCDVATVTIDMQANPNGNSTFATDDSFFGKEDNLLTGNVLANDYDPQGDIQSVNTFVVIPPNHGSVSIDVNGTFVYKPVPNYFGQDRFVYEVCDNGNPKACDQGTVYLIVAPQNDPPVAKDDIAITFKDKAIGGNLLTNDSDPDGDLLIVKTTPVIAPANGSIVINPDGTYTYTSNTGFVGTDSFVYEVCDNASPAMCDQAKVTIKVIDYTAGTNNAPVAINDSYQGSIDLAVFGNVISNDFDLDGNLNMNSVKLIGSAPSSGSLTLNPDGTFTYIPVIGYLGQVTFDYQICDLGTPALCDIATVTIEILANPNGNSTFATDDSFAGIEDNPITGNLLANDNDPELNIQTVNTTAVIAPIHGSVVLNANGTFTYTPAPNYNGTDRFVYEVCDNGIPRACDRATVYLIILPGDDVPVAVDDTNTTNEETSVTGNVSTNDIPSNDGGIVLSVVDLPEQGELVFNPDGVYIYTPDADFNGIDQFVYKLCDIDGDCSEATVSITVNPVNDLPEANDDAIVYHLEGIIDTTVVENDILSGDGGNVWSIVTPPVNGSIIFNPDGTFTYTAKPNFIGTDSFIYQLCDANGDCDQARVTIQIEDVIQPNQIFTPNGDGQNDTYHIAGIEYYPGSKLTIFNRWGNIVYQKIGYLNDWDGFSNVSKVGSTALPVGTYFYVLDYGFDKHKAGYVYLER
jgi:large repetitive protein